MKEEKWHTVTVHAGNNDIDALCTLFWSLKPEGLFDDDETDTVIGYFREENLNLTEINEKLGPYNPVIAPYVNQDWLANYRESVKSFIMAEGVRVSPPWQSQKQEGELELLINPAMAFGSGSHETTRMVAEKILKYGKGKTNFLDIGCGSGILTILAYLTGIKDCAGFDIDEDSIENALENAGLNGVKDKITLKCCSIDDIKNSYELIGCNIIRSTIFSIYKEITEKVKQGGIIIFSGLLNTEQEEFINYISTDYKILEATIMGEWLSVTAEKK